MAESSSTEPPTQPSNESDGAAGEISSSDQESEDDEQEEGDDYEQEGDEHGPQALLQSPDETVVEEETEQDELLREIQSSSKKHQRLVDWTPHAHVKVSDCHGVVVCCNLELLVNFAC